MGFESYAEAVLMLARRFSLFYAPVYETMKAYGDGALASADPVHPSDAGHRAISGAFIGADRP